MSLDRLFSPRGIAVVGASEDRGRPGSQTVLTLIRHGYRGGIYPVNPRYPEYEGLRCYPSLAAVEGEVDLAVIGVPARGVNAVVAECGEHGVPYAVVLGGGFRESGERGAALQDEIVATARRGGVRLVGPNCLGVANIHENVYAAFGSITRPPKLAPGAVSLVTQSGGFGYSIALACAEAGVGFRYVVATGNEADLDMADFLGALIDDAATRVIIAYMEGLRDGRVLLDMGARALAAGKPLLVWKGGVTRAGAQAAATHTANLTGSYDYYRAAFRQAGIIEIREIHEAADLAQAFIAGKLPAGRRVAVMGGSGGSAIVLADAAEQAGLALAELTGETQARLRPVVPEIGSVQNPVDLTAGYIPSRGADQFRVAVEAVLADPGVDALCINLATTENQPARAGALVLADVARTSGKPLFVFLSTPRALAQEALAALAAGSIPTLPSPVRLARALAVLAAWRERRERPVQTAAEGPAQSASPEPLAGTLSEAASKAVLARAGIPVTRDVLVRDPAELAWDGLRPPLAVKIASPDIPHKTDIGAVRLNVASRGELEGAVRDVLAAVARHAPRAAIEGVIVSEMVTGGYELLAGVVNDAVFGPVVVLGAGGIHAEVLRDSTCRIAPFGPEIAREMVDELRCAAVLRGVRGQPPADLAALADALARLSRFAWENRETIAEVDINPLFATAQGVVAADALIVGRENAR